MIEAYCCVLVGFSRGGGGILTPEEQPNRLSSLFKPPFMHAARIPNRNLKDIPFYRCFEDVHKENTNCLAVNPGFLQMVVYRNIISVFVGFTSIDCICYQRTLMKTSEILTVLSLRSMLAGQ